MPILREFHGPFCESVAYISLTQNQIINQINIFCSVQHFVVSHYTVFQKKTSTHIIGYKLRNSFLIVIIFDIKIPHII